MLRTTQVIATNDMIKLPDGTIEVIADEALEGMAQHVNASGGTPMLLEHDWTRPVGWTRRAWIERDGPIARLCTEGELPETAEEQEALTELFARYFAEQHDRHTGPFRSSLASFGDGSVDLCHDFCCVYLTGDELLDRLEPEARQALDDDGLVPVEAAEFVGDGWIRRGG